MTRRDDRKAFFFSAQGFIFSRLGDVARADDAYRRAIELERDPAKQAEYEQARQRRPESLTARSAGLRRS